MAKRRRRRRRKIPEGLFQSSIHSLSHDGRGICDMEGKKVFVDGALTGETVEFEYVFSRSTFDEARVTSVLEPSGDREDAPCVHHLVCGGCSLQHMKRAAQLDFKQQNLLEMFRHSAGVEPGNLLPPLESPAFGYRYKARLGVKYVRARERVMVGFREKRNSFIADIETCPVLLEKVGKKIPELANMIGQLEAKATIPQIEVAAGDRDIALVFRHLEPLSDDDLVIIRTFCEHYGFHLYLQPGGPKTVHMVSPQLEKERLDYELPDFGVHYTFHPQDFTQVNPFINRQMVSQAIDLLEPAPADKVLDLFCGLGNFTLPIATMVSEVTGIEGSEEMVERARENAMLNGMENASFYAADLFEDFTGSDWSRGKFNKILVDPPRSGAENVMQNIETWNPDTIVYVSCNPATLARDAGILVEKGYQLDTAGIMDMFPHTTHIESVARFRKL